jgi:hypothetical protein
VISFLIGLTIIIVAITAILISTGADKFYESEFVTPDSCPKGITK